MATIKSKTKIRLTGDDFGASSQINEAVEAFHEAGVLTDASLLVGGPAIDEALRIARRQPSLRVGLHLALVDPDPFRLRTLGHTSPQTLPRSPARAGLAAIGVRQRKWMLREMEAQFRRFQQILPGGTHWDGHTHFHLHPFFFEEGATLGRHFGLRRVRVALRAGAFHPSGRILARLGKRAARVCRSLGLDYDPLVLGLAESGSMTAPDLARLQGTARSFPGQTEIYFHPGQDPVTPGEAVEALKPHVGPDHR